MAAVTAQSIVQEGMTLLGGDIDGNIEAFLIKQLGGYLNSLYATHDIDQAVSFKDITIPTTEALPMDDDLLRVESIVLDRPYYKQVLTKLDAPDYNIVQSEHQGIATTPPEYFYPDYKTRNFRFVPVSAATLGAKLAYYAELQGILPTTDLQFFPNHQLLILFVYIRYSNYDRVPPAPNLLEDFRRLEMQFKYKYGVRKRNIELSVMFFPDIR